MWDGTRRDFSTGPTLVATGAEAMKEASKRLARAVPATILSGMGWVDLKPGTIWSGNQMLVSGDGAVVYYMVDDRLYTERTSVFVRGHYFEALSQAARSAMPMVTLAQYEITFLAGALVPWYIALGVTGAALGLFYRNNRELVDSVIDSTQAVMQLLDEVKKRAPTLYDILIGRIWQQIREGLSKSGITTEDVLSLVASILATIVTSKALASAKPELQAVSKRICSLLGEIVRALSIDFLSQIPAKSVQVAQRSGTEAAGALMKSLSRAGYRVTSNQEKMIEKEMNNWPGSIEKLKQLRKDCETLLMMLTQLGKALEKQGIL